MRPTMSNVSNMPLLLITLCQTSVSSSHLCHAGLLSTHVPVLTNFFTSVCLVMQRFFVLHLIYKTFCIIPHGLLFVNKQELALERASFCLQSSKPKNCGARTASAKKAQRVYHLKRRENMDLAVKNIKATF